MAILPAHPGIQITVVCNGAALQEYDDDDADEQSDKKISKYIESTSGAEFGIQFVVTPPWPAYAIYFEIWLDQKIVGRFLCPQDNYKYPAWSYLDVGALEIVGGKAYTHNFAFASLDFDDSAAVQEQMLEDIKGIGEVTVRALFAKNVRARGVNDQALTNHGKTVGKIPEKVLKGRSLSHQTFLRAPQAIKQAPQSFMYDYVDAAGAPFATYTFKYRSRNALQSLLIIPRTPSPVPLEERDVDTLSAEEMRELLRRQRERDAAARAVKQERGVKREYTHDRSSTYTDDTSDEISVVSSKKRRENYRTLIDENGVEAIDLT